MRPLTLVLTAAVLLALAVPAAADAATWRSCKVTGNVGVTEGPDAVGVFSRLRARAPMSCRSARWVLNRWVRRQYARNGYLEGRFYDGYVTWRGVVTGSRTTGSRASKVIYDEATSGTAFRFDFSEYAD
jgi:hypothetical protein